MKNIIIIIQVLIISVLCSCSRTVFIDDGNGHKQYKDKNGNFVKTEWVDLNGKKYYFDRNGYLVTNQWIDNEYYVDENGVMKTNYWYDGENGYYYLDNEGKYLRNTIKEIDGNYYAFDLNGINIKNAPFVSNGDGYYFGSDGKADKTEGWKIYLDTYCYVKTDGQLLISDWKEDNDKWYYFNEIGLMLKNQFVDGKYYVNKQGEMIKNQRLKIGNVTYNFNVDGSINTKKINKECNYIINKFNTLITYDMNGTIWNRERDMQFRIDGEEMYFSIYDSEFSKYLSNELFAPRKETFLEIEDGTRIKVFYWIDGGILCFGFKTVWDIYKQLKTQERGIINFEEQETGEKIFKQRKQQIIDLLLKDEDTKYKIYIPELKDSITAEILVGNFKQVYSNYK